MKKQIVQLLTAAILTTTIVALLPCPPLSAKTYKIASTHWVGFSPLNVAEAKGFWKEQGIDVQIVNNADPAVITKQIQNKEVDIGMHMMGTWVGLYQDNVPVKIIAETDWSSGGDKIIVKKNITPDQIKGKTVGTYDSSPAVTFLLNKYLSQNNLSLSDVKLAEFDPENLADNFISGRFNLIINFDPQALRAEKSGQGTVAATSATYPGCIPEGMGMHNEIYQQTPKEDVVKILKGWIKAVAWCQNSANWTEYMQILNTKTFEGEAPYSEADLKGMLGAVKIHTPQELAERNKTDGGLFTYLKELQAFLSANGMLKKNFSPSDVFDNTAVVEAIQGGN